MSLIKQFDYSQFERLKYSPYRNFEQQILLKNFFDEGLMLKLVAFSRLMLWKKPHGPLLQHCGISYFKNLTFPCIKVWQHVVRTQQIVQQLSSLSSSYVESFDILCLSKLHTLHTGEILSNLAEELLLIFFQAAGDVTEQNVSEWVNSERFEAFVHASKSNFNDIAETGKQQIHMQVD